ncbi:MAG: lipid II:glycine glycyltransferase FemX [Roseburia sp.]
MKIISIQQKEIWNEIVKSFPEWDIYYLNEYAYSLKLHGDGEPYLIYEEYEGGRLCYVVMQEDISTFPPLSDYLEKGKCYDWSTPYGYGGPLVDGEITENWMRRFLGDLSAWCHEHGVITQFLRYHPLQQNQRLMEEISDVLYMKKTVYVDTTDKEIIFQNMTPNNRNMVRKAIKNGVQIVTDHGERLDEFIEIYEKTMQKHHAAEYYYFEKQYFEYLRDYMKENVIFFYAVYQEKTISASIFFYNAQYMHYHLSGTLQEYRNLAAANLLLSRAAEWAAEHGIGRLHLGGGVEAEDSLLAFKKHFNRNGLIDFCIGRTIFDEEMYEELVDLRVQHDKNFDATKKYLIKYRG